MYCRVDFVDEQEKEFPVFLLTLKTCRVLEEWNQIRFFSSFHLFFPAQFHRDEEKLSENENEKESHCLSFPPTSRLREREKEKENCKAN